LKVFSQTNFVRPFLDFFRMIKQRAIQALTMFSKKEKK